MGWVSVDISDQGGFEQKPDLCVLGGRLIFSEAHHRLSGFSADGCKNRYCCVFSEIFVGLHQASCLGPAGTDAAAEPCAGTGDSSAGSSWALGAAPPQGGDTSEIKKLSFLADLYLKKPNQTKALGVLRGDRHGRSRSCGCIKLEILNNPKVMQVLMLLSFLAQWKGGKKNLCVYPISRKMNCK